MMFKYLDFAAFIDTFLGGAFGTGLHGLKGVR